jgi:hypothetical protein
MSGLPTTHGFEFRQERVASEVDLADWFGEPVWVPAKWPGGYERPELLILHPPPGESDVNGWLSCYMLLSDRGKSGGELLEVFGSRRPPVRNLEAGLLPVEGERLETWTRPAHQTPHIVVCAPVWDVGVSGSLTVATALSVARTLTEVSGS